MKLKLALELAGAICPMLFVMGFFIRDLPGGQRLMLVGVMGMIVTGVGLSVGMH